jgi:hypothetical protein
MKTSILPKTLRLSLPLLLLMLVALYTLPGLAQTPQFMSYQGYLTDGNGNALGSTNTGPKAYDVVFRIWDLPTGGTIGGPDELFAELQTVTVDNGYFSVLLGQGTPYNGEPRVPLSNVFTSLNTPRYVEMTVLGIGVGGNPVTILPRLQLVDAPYALLAVNAVNITGTNVITAANLSTNLGLWQANGPNIYYPSGNVGIGTPSPTARLQSQGHNIVNLFAGDSAPFGSAGFETWFSTPQTHIWCAEGPGQTNVFRVGPGGAAYFAGSVGIGATAPASMLDVNGSGHFNGAVGITANNFLQFGAGLAGQEQNGGKIGYETFTGDSLDIVGAGTTNTNRKIKFWAEGGATFSGGATFNSGNVGIGTTAPVSPLHIVTSGLETLVASSSSTAGTWLDLQNTSTGGTNWDIISTGSGNGGGPGQLIFNTGSSPFSTVNTVLTLSSSGYVGIGTLSPADPLDVEGDNYHDIGGQFWYIFSNGSPGSFSGPAIAAAGSHLNPIGIYAANGIQTGVGFYVTSDRRIKKDFSRSDPRQDLAVLKQLAVTDFSYIDFVEHGNQHKKGVIAQEVEKVFPTAVNQKTGVVPDIYKMAGYQNGWVTLANELKKGDRVRLITQKGASVHEVLEATPERFRTDFKPGGDKVFVYGREVNDFRSVDYDAISMLNVSATQELAKRVEQLEARESHVAELEQKASQVAALEEEVADLKKMVAQLAQSTKGGHSNGQTASWTGTKEETRLIPVALGQ